MSLPLGDGLIITMREGRARDPRFPTGRLQKGLVLALRGRDLAEEGVGFGVPVLKRGTQTVFPGGASLSWRRRGDGVELTAAFTLNLVERLAGGASGVRSPAFYRARDALAALHRRAPALRDPLTQLSSAVRDALGWVTTFEEIEPLGVVRVDMSAPGDKGTIALRVDTTGVRGGGVTEIVVMNELGAGAFTQYHDSDGVSLEGDQIGTWEAVTAARASFASAAHDVSFSVAQAQGARLYRGRELVGARLAWAGFAYSLPPRCPGFAYDLWIGGAR